MNNQSPILITGCPRSGTTFCGKIISEARDVYEVYEPFNRNFTYHLDMPRQFFQVSAENQDIYKPRIDHMMRLANLYHRILATPRGAIDRFRDNKDMNGSLALKTLVRDRENYFSASRLSIKDPLAFYSAEWFAETYEANVIMMCRHPAGVISSFLGLDWTPETEHIVNYALPLSEGMFEREIAAWKKDKSDRVGALILQWKLFTQATLDYRRLHPNWTFCLHDQLCEHPVDVFRTLFAAVDLPFTDEIQAKVTRNTHANIAENHTEFTQHNFKRSSVEVKNSWKDRLDDATMSRILAETEALWAQAKETFELNLKPASSIAKSPQTQSTTTEPHSIPGLPTT